MNLSKEEEDFGCDVMEHEEKTTTTSLPMHKDSTNEVVINLFML
jgi:hypothetical protein